MTKTDAQVLAKLKTALKEATKKYEESKKTGFITLAFEAADVAITALTEAVQHIEKSLGDNREER